MTCLCPTLSRGVSRHLPFPPRQPHREPQTSGCLSCQRRWSPLHPTYAGTHWILDRFFRPRSSRPLPTSRRSTQNETLLSISLPSFSLHRELKWRPCAKSVTSISAARKLWLRPHNCPLASSTLYQVRHPSRTPPPRSSLRLRQLRECVDRVPKAGLSLSVFTPRLLPRPLKCPAETVEAHLRCLPRAKPELLVHPT